MARQRRYRWRGFGEQARNPAKVTKTKTPSGSLFGPATGPQITFVRNLRRRHGLSMEGLQGLSKADASAEIERLTRRE